MSRIHLAGVYLWLWGVWHVAWAAGFVVVTPLWGGAATAAWFTALYAAFLPLEISGVLVNRRHGDGRARTLSEWRQYVAAMAPDRPGIADDLLGWRGLAGATGILDAGVMGLIVGYHAQSWTAVFVGQDLAYPVGVAVGLAWGFALAVWLVPHFGWREWIG